MAALTNPNTGQTITVPDHVEESYTSRGWVRPGTPAPAEPANPLDSMTAKQLRAHAEEHGIDLGDATKKADIRAAIDAAGPI